MVFLSNFQPNLERLTIENNRGLKAIGISRP